MHAQHPRAVRVLLARRVADAGPAARRPARRPWCSVLAFVYAMFAIAGAGAETVFYGFLLLLRGLPVYVWLRRAGGGAG